MEVWKSIRWCDSYALALVSFLPFVVHHAPNLPHKYHVPQVAESNQQLRPQLLVRRDMMGSISAIGAGIVLRPGRIDICVATFSGSVIGLEVDLDDVDADFETDPSNLEGANAKAMQPSTKVIHDFRNNKATTIRKRNQHEILMKDIASLERQVGSVAPFSLFLPPFLSFFAAIHLCPRISVPPSAQVKSSNNYYEALLREDNVHIKLSTRSSSHIKCSLNLDKATALHILQIESNLSIFAAIIHSEVPMEVIDTEDVQYSVIRNPIDNSPEDPTEAFMANFRCVDATNRLCISLRILEGLVCTYYRYR